MTPDRTPLSLADLRKQLHGEICANVLSIRASRSAKGTPTPVYGNADKHSETSVDFAARLAERLPPAEAPKMRGTAVGRAFERVIMGYIKGCLKIFPGSALARMQVGPGQVISNFAQFAHLDEIQAAVKENPELEATLGGDYLVKPDLVVSWQPLTDTELGSALSPAAAQVATLSPTRASSPGSGLPILHASISCKWTIRSDRVQNTRTESLNLVRNRKGRTPHIVAVTMEPDPQRLEAIALGTGDIDCVYHAALTELRGAADEAATAEPNRASSRRRLEMMISSSRVRDISDLPLDLVA